MPRSVVLQSSPRCDGCRLPLRWCVCAGRDWIECPLAVDVIMSSREQFRPTSTGHLVTRTMDGSRSHIWRRERRTTVDEVRLPDRELWILHPAGGAMPPRAVPENVQVILIDGSWRESSAIAQEIGRWGRLINLPMSGESRYWLRAQADAARFCTAEALLFLLGALGLDEQAARLRMQFELHVYASLRARGGKERAQMFLQESPVRERFAALIEQLDVRRPR